MPELLAAVAKEMDLFLPVQNNGITNFGFWTEDAKVDLDTLKTVKSPKDAFFPQSEVLYSCLILSVELIDIFDEFTIQKVQRNMLRTYAGTLAAVRAASGNVECTDDVEHLLLKCRSVCFLCSIVTIIVKYAFDTAAGRTYVAACITADTAGKLILPECEPFFRSHCLKLFNQFETAFFCRFFLVTAFCKLIVCYMFSTLAGFASLEDDILSFQLFVTINRCNFDGIAVLCYSGYTLAACFTDFLDIVWTARKPTSLV